MRLYLNYCLEKQDISEEEKSNILVMSPNISNQIRLFSNDIEVADLLVDLEMINKNMVIMCINNASEMSSGTHWSTLLFIPPKHLFHHIDTIHNGNINVAYTTTMRIASLLNIENPIFLNCQDKLQTNGYDMLAYARLL